MKMKAVMITAMLVLGAANAQAQSATGQVKKVDAGAGKMTIDHGPIKNLDMDSMTMVFRVRDPAMLEGLAVGDKLKVDINKVDGQYTVTAMKKAP